MSEDLIPLPKTLPKTQSFYYMPILTDAYNKFNRIPNPPGLIKQINSIKQLDLLTDDRYNLIITGLLYKFEKHPELLIKMFKSYSGEEGFGDKYSKLPEMDAGHIKGKLQEEILEKSYVKNNEIFPKEIFGDSETKKIKDVLDFIILSNYFKNKYLKYKYKYLSLKNKINI